MAVPFVTCMTLVASLYTLPPRVLPSIHVVEGGQVGTTHLNNNGSEDLGYMQINTRWLPTLSRYTGQSEEAVRQNLLGRACYNIAAAGFIMRNYLNESRGDLMQAIGDYHSHTPPLNQAYQALVLGSAARLFAKSGSGPAPSAPARSPSPIRRSR